MFKLMSRSVAVVATLVLACSGGSVNTDSVETDDVVGEDVPNVPDSNNPVDVFDVASDLASEMDFGDDGQEVVATDEGADADIIVLPELVITKAVLPVVDAGQSLQQALEVTGGRPPYSGWTVIKGSLPAGVELDSDTGMISGIPTERGFSWFVVEVGDSNGTRAGELFGIRVGEPGSTGPLRERADAYQAVYEARHDWGGFSYNCNTPDDPDGNLRLTTLGDATFQSGQCTMAMAYRDAVERTPQTSAYLKKQVDGWRFFQNLTGVPGLIGRSWGRVDYPWEDNHHSNGFWPDNPDSRSYRAEGEYEGYIWVGDVSRDQASGAVLGVAAAYDLANDPQTKATAAAFLTDLVDHVWDNNLDFLDKNEQPPRYGNIDGDNFEGWLYPNGLNAACSLAWFRIAAHVAESEGLEEAGRFRERYQELLSRGYIGYMRDYMWVYDGYKTKHFNTYMAYENLFHLARLEDDPVLGPQIDDIFRDTLWLNLDDNTPNRKGVKEGNPVKTTWYLYSTGDRDPVALWDALWQVVVFPDAPLRDRYVKNSDDPEIVVNPDEPTESLYPLPSNRLQPDMVIWHRSTFLLDGGVDSGEERTGCDYLLPYWMGRYYGWIDAGW